MDLGCRLYTKDLAMFPPRPDESVNPVVHAARVQPVHPDRTRAACTTLFAFAVWSFIHLPSVWGEDNWAATAPIVELSEDEPVGSPLTPPVIVRQEITTGTPPESEKSEPATSTSEQTNTEDGTCRTASLAPIKNAPILAPILAPVIRGRPARTRDPKRIDVDSQPPLSVDAGHRSGGGHLAPVIKRQPASADRMLPKARKPSYVTTEGNGYDTLKYGDSTESRPVTIDMTDRQPVDVADSEAESSTQVLST